MPWNIQLTEGALCGIPSVFSHHYPKKAKELITKGLENQLWQFTESYSHKQTTASNSKTKKESYFRSNGLRCIDHTHHLQVANSWVPVNSLRI